MIPSHISPHDPGAKRVKISISERRVIFIFQNTGFILHRENARAIVRRSAGPAVAAHGLLASAAAVASANADEASA